MRRRPVIEIAGEIERVIVDDLEVGGDDLAARGADLEAQIEVVTVKRLAEFLVEANVADHPWRERQHKAIDRVDLTGWAYGARLVSSQVTEGKSPPPSSV